MGRLRVLSGGVALGGWVGGGSGWVVVGGGVVPGRVALWLAAARGSDLFLCPMYFCHAICVTMSYVCTLFLLICFVFKYVPCTAPCPPGERRHINKVPLIL